MQHLKICHFNFLREYLVYLMPSSDHYWKLQLHLIKLGVMQCVNV